MSLASTNVSISLQQWQFFHRYTLIFEDFLKVLETKLILSKKYSCIHLNESYYDDRIFYLHSKLWGYKKIKNILLTTT